MICPLIMRMIPITRKDGRIMEYINNQGTIISGLGLHNQKFSFHHQF